MEIMPGYYETSPHLLSAQQKYKKIEPKDIEGCSVIPHPLAPCTLH